MASSWPASQTLPQLPQALLPCSDLNVPVSATKPVPVQAVQIRSVLAVQGPSWPSPTGQSVGEHTVQASPATENCSVPHAAQTRSVAALQLLDSSVPAVHVAAQSWQAGVVAVVPAVGLNVPTAA
jgi:hypothetical protein